MLSSAFRALMTIESSALLAHRAEIDSIFNELKVALPALFTELEPELNNVLAGLAASSQLDDQPATLAASSPQNKETKPDGVVELRKRLNTALEAEELTEAEESSFGQSNQCFYDAIFNILIALAWQFPLNQRNDMGQPYDDLMMLDESDSLTPENSNAVATPDGRLHKKDALNQHFLTNNAFFVVGSGAVVSHIVAKKILSDRVINHLRSQGITIRLPTLRELRERIGHGGQRFDQPAPGLQLQPFSPAQPQPFELNELSHHELLRRLVVGIALADGLHDPELQITDDLRRRFILSIILSDDLFHNNIESQIILSDNIRRDPALQIAFSNHLRGVRHEQPPPADLEEPSMGYKISYGIALFHLVLERTILTFVLGFLSFSFIGSGVGVPTLIFYGVSSVGLALACAYNKPGSYQEKLTLFFQTIFATHKESTSFYVICFIPGFLVFPGILPVVAIVAALVPALISLRFSMMSNAENGMQSYAEFMQNSISEERRCVLKVASEIRKCSKGIMSMLRLIRDACFPRSPLDSPQNAVVVTVPPQQHPMSTQLSLNRLGPAVEEAHRPSFSRWFLDFNGITYPPLISFFQRNQHSAVLAAIRATHEGQQRLHRH